MDAILDLFAGHVKNRNKIIQCRGPALIGAWASHLLASFVMSQGIDRLVPMIMRVLTGRVNAASIAALHAAVKCKQAGLLPLERQPILVSPQLASAQRPGERA
jgi:hypothetical protein